MFGKPPDEPIVRYRMLRFVKADDYPRNSFSFVSNLKKRFGRLAADYPVVLIDSICGLHQML